MDAQQRAETVAQRLADGRLPRTKPVKLWAGFGDGSRACDGCGDPIARREIEHEQELETGPALRFHAACSVLWEKMVGGRTPG